LFSFFSYLFIFHLLCSLLFLLYFNPVLYLVSVSFPPSSFLAFPSCVLFYTFFLSNSISFLFITFFISYLHYFLLSFFVSSSFPSLLLHPCSFYLFKNFLFLPLYFPFCTPVKREVKVKVKLSLCFNLAPRNEGVLRECKYSTTHSSPRH
jgi:hypothetical protein